MAADPFVALDQMETLTNMLATEVGRQVREQTEGAKRTKADVVLSGMTHLQRRIVYALACSKHLEAGTRAELARILGVNPQGVLKAVRPLLEQQVIEELLEIWDTKRKYLRLTPFGVTVAERYKKLRSDALRVLLEPDAQFLSAAMTKQLRTAINRAREYIRGPID
jgi:DNA-binding MarR family transcriptional regulator